MLPHTSDLSSTMLTKITDKQLPKKYSLVLAAYSATSEKTTFTTTADFDLVYRVYCNICHSLNITQKSPRTFQNYRKILSSKGLLSFSYYKKLVNGAFKTATTVTLNIEMIASSFKRAYRAALTKSKCRYSKKVREVNCAEKQKVADRIFSPVPTRLESKKVPQEICRRSTSYNTQQLKDKRSFVSKVKKYVPNMFVTSEQHADLYNNRATPELVKHARTVMAFFGLPFKYFQYNNTGHLAIDTSKQSKELERETMNRIKRIESEQREATLRDIHHASAVYTHFNDLSGLEGLI